MVSNLKSMYQEKYENDTNKGLELNQNNDEQTIDLPTGWSFVCLNETINYYTEYSEKD